MYSYSNLLAEDEKDLESNIISGRIEFPFYIQKPIRTLLTSIFQNDTAFRPSLFSVELF